METGQSLRTVLVFCLASGLGAQSFDVTSVKPGKPGLPANSNFPLGPGDVYVPNGGFFSATGFPLITYIAFAYKILGNQMEYLLPQMPGWAKTEGFDIQARAAGNPGKDQMRLMMRSLLADRFALKIHTETRQVPVFGLVLLKAGKTGPQLQKHPEDPSCSTAPGAGTAAPAATVAGGYPALCGGILGMPASAPGRMRIGARNVTLALIANGLSQIGNLGRPVLDQTGIGGTVDFTLEWTPEISTLPPGVDFKPDESGPSFLEALKTQLGLKLDSQKGPVEVMVVDHVERPSAN